MDESIADQVITLLKSALLSTTSLVLGAAVIVVLFADVLLTPRLDSNEPPLLKPSIPLIGHIIGIIRYQNEYHRMLKNKYQLPITSLQMLWGKIYAIWDPSLVQAALRARSLSVEPFFREFSEKSFGLGPTVLAKVNSNLVVTFMEATHGSMQPSHLQGMNVVALNYISRTLDSICREGSDGGEKYVPNLYLWFRDTISLATTRALLGEENPYEKDPSLVEAAWDFEAGLADIVTRPMPWLTARKAYNARSRLQQVMADYYTAQHDVNDPTAAQITKARAGVLRAHGFEGSEIAMIEFILVVISITNTGPSMFWMFCHIFARPTLVERLRDELSGVVERSQTGTEDTAAINVSRLGAECPLLCACYRETLRLIAHNVSMRRVVKDTTLSESSGRSYTLMEGIDVQIALGPPHFLASVWGEDVDDFNPERFLDGKGAHNDKAKKNAYAPFGGGAHYCPGRNFAFTEILALTSAFVMGFEATPVGMAFDEAKKTLPVFTTAVLKPVREGEGLGTKFRRRQGWEHTNWKFES